MFGLFVSKKKKEQKARLTRLQNLSSAFQTLETLEKHSLLTWVQKDRRLFIALPLASVMIGRGMEGFRCFLDNVFLYHSKKEMDREYRRVLIDRERKAIKDRIATGDAVKPGELDSIRRAVRDTLQYDDITPPRIEPFEFFVVSDSIKGYSEAEISFVGSYNPDTERVDMASWDDVQAILSEKGS